MRKNNQHIPVNIMTENSNQGMSIDRISLEKPKFTHSHRDDGHTFHIIKRYYSD